MSHLESKKSGWIAIADLGTNTFQLLIAKLENGKMRTGLRKKVGVKIGKGGMGKMEIQPDAVQRAIDTLKEFSEDLEKFDLRPADCIVLGTSAFRNANNRTEVIKMIEQQTGFHVDIPTGDEEAALIFSGVLASGAILSDRTSLVVDIGGGSVEFIICKGQAQVWRQSFEIGGLRLLEKFHHNDPISKLEMETLHAFLESELSALWRVINDCKPDVLVGCSGSFDTLIEMTMAAKGQPIHDVESNPFYSLDLADFEELKLKIVCSTLEERLQMKGMIPLRAEMMVVAILLIDCLLNKMENPQIRTSTFALKEGRFFQFYESTF